MNIKKYRMYIDEVGNSDVNASNDINHQYLSLTGVIFELEYVKEVIAGKVEKLKEKYFDSHPDEPIILHRKDLLNYRKQFAILRDIEIKRNFDQDLLLFLEESEYVVITVVLDKLEFKQRYKVWRSDPYHYCLEILVERFLHWLQQMESVGDVLAESRGGNDDMRLKEAFCELYANGTEYVYPQVFASYLTSKQLKIKNKANNIAGLQIADLIAHPSFKATLATQNKSSYPNNFGLSIIEILNSSKYYRSPTGNIDGWGRKWLP